MRAGAAKVGLYGNDAVEAMYPYTRTDAAGEVLDASKHNYTITFPSGQLPPVEAFWSVTMYDTPDFYLVENPIERYSIGDRTSGLHYADDGSLTIAIQRDAPSEPDRAAIWLPTPAGTFRPILRMYSRGVSGS